MLPILHNLTVLAIQNFNDGLPRPANANGALQTVLNIVIGTVAALSVLFIVIGGLRYVLSEGDPQAAGKAKSTIVYALVGLLIAITAEAIVAFLLDNLIKNG